MSGEAGLFHKGKGWCSLRFSLRSSTMAQIPSKSPLATEILTTSSNTPVTTYALPLQNSKHNDAFWLVCKENGAFWLVQDDVIRTQYVSRCWVLDFDLSRVIRDPRRLLEKRSLGVMRNIDQFNRFDRFDWLKTSKMSQCQLSHYTESVSES